MQRACAAALINNGTTIIDNAGNSNDEQAAKNIVQKLGATVDTVRKEVIITSNNHIFSSTYPGKHSVISVGESGLSLRMFTPLAALFKHEITFTGEGSILKRPVDFFENVFPQLGVDIQTTDGKIPLALKGPLKPKNITVDGSLSSQFLTGLLMAYAKACTVPVSIKVNNLKSKPYIDLTLQVMKLFGWDVKHRNYEEFYFDPKIPKVSPNGGDLEGAFVVEGDWSGAAFLLVAGAVAGEIIVDGLNINSAQADKAILSALKMAGAKISVDDNKISVIQESLNPFHFDATDCPDLFPPLVVLADYCNGTSSIKGVSRLTHKESNRAI